MSNEDRSRWDKKWASLTREFDKPHKLILKHRYLLAGGPALDLACGRGQNALWLGEIGYTVLGVDISPVALRIAREQAKKSGLDQLVRFEEVDLTSWVIPQLAFELILVFRFLERRLFPDIKSAVRPGGLLFYATRHKGVLKKDPDANPDYLLNMGELPATFQDWEILYQREGSDNAELVARKPINEVHT
jgi:SAM-dependent methyltransferase